MGKKKAKEPVAAPEREAPVERITTDYSGARMPVGSDPEGKSYTFDREIDIRFTYAPPFGDQPLRYIAIRAAAKGLALLILKYCPPSRERELALTALDQVVMWANASIARREVQG